MGKYYPRNAPNLPTVQKIHELAEYREQNRDKWGKPPTRISACRAIHLNYRTFQRHAPELLKKWNDPDFHW
jgi:hypothetical protein